MNSKLLGGILLIVGTTIGGGMLALPLATSPAGFWNASLLLIICWIIMTLSAFLILEVNLWLPPNSNLISMAKATLGKPGQIIAWASYLLLLYSLLAAYVAGGGDFFQHLLSLVGINLSAWLASLLFTVILGFIVYQGIRIVDYMNRGLMTGKLALYLLLVLAILSFTSLSNLDGGEPKYLTASITVVVTSFGFAIIVPSLRTYFDSDVKKLRTAILMGSLIPLFCYLLWLIAIMGVLPRSGEHGLTTLLHSEHSTSDLVNAVSAQVQRDSITILARAFTSISLATSFLGVSLSLSDFLADGLQISKASRNKWLIYGATFIPPLLIVGIYPGAFITALSQAGIFCGILLVLLPALMAWWGRYRKKLATGYQLWGGKSVLLIAMVSGVLIIAQGILDNFPLY